MRWVVHGVLFVALLPGAVAYLRLRLSPNAAGKARPSTPPAG